MPQICPHCRHVRKEHEVAPEWQCPACERAYVKGGDSSVDRAVRTIRPTLDLPREGSSKLRWLLLLALVGAALWYWRPGWLGSTKADDVVPGQAEVVLYATSWCGYCAATRDFFHRNGIEYTEFDIERDPKAQQEHQRLGGNGVPLIVVGDTAIHGYNEAELRRTLRPWLRGS